MFSDRISLIRVTADNFRKRNIEPRFVVIIHGPSTKFVTKSFNGDEIRRRFPGAHRQNPCVAGPTAGSGVIDLVVCVHCDDAPSRQAGQSGVPRRRRKQRRRNQHRAAEQRICLHAGGCPGLAAARLRISPSTLSIVVQPDQSEEEAMNENSNNRRHAEATGCGTGTTGCRGRFRDFHWGQAPIKVKCGYIHTIAVDGQIWAGDHIGAWRKEGLDMEFIKFDSGLAIFQAMVSGSIDMLSVGASLFEFSGERARQGVSYQFDRICHRAVVGAHRPERQWLRRPEGQENLDCNRFDGRRVSAACAGGKRGRPGQGCRNCQSAHAGCRCKLRRGCRSRRGAVGTIQPDGRQRTCRPPKCWSMRPPIIRRRPSSAAGWQAINSTRSART